MSPLHTLRAHLAARIRAPGTNPAAAATTSRAPATQPAEIAATIDRALSAAGISAGGQHADLRSTIDRALAQAGLLAADGSGVAFRAADAPGRSSAASFTAAAGPATARTSVALDPLPPTRPAMQDCKTTTAGAGRRYRLYVPSALASADAPEAPLVVMLHGCTQDPEDFAAGTRMNTLADAHGFIVAWPEQPARDNGSRCWNWFRPGDQQRGRGEPAQLVAIVEDIAAMHRVDRARVYVAGLSAGAAMAVILGQTYPDVFAAVGAHSGLPHGAASDVASAFAAMQGRSNAATPRGTSAVPTIVFQGDADRTVHMGNANTIAGAAIAAHGGAALPVTAATGSVPGGRRYASSVASDDAGRPLVAQWTVHGAGHAWAGGAAAGSYTDPEGPDASAEMVRFFMRQRRAAAA